ncbi:hypothetical protein [Microcella frigidaquae]|uniref:Uncharacterized protein n=1 Tax=Microcella frigidaquae TaxID=424758 RepID=A0A840X987_9MICO|nr:hypothetical protein [Microcella frigidaquae]MBB5618940.1 hypothetical protein [Microcella frigidaquae]NHN44906.1 hypothetical protein [Microcella frigidaquae]
MTGTFRSYRPAPLADVGHRSGHRVGHRAGRTRVITPEHPLTEAELESPEAQLAYALGPALRWQLWLFLPPTDDGFTGLAMPCDDLPLRCPPDAGAILVPLLHGLHEAGARTLIVGLERTGGPDPTRVDREWMLALSTAAHEADLTLRSVLISHTRGVREHPAPSPALPLEL